MKQFHSVPEISKKEAEDAFASGNAEKICHALISISFHHTDHQEVEETCLHFLEHKAPEVSGLAATCLGHLARIHALKGKEQVVNALREQLENPDIKGRVEDALEDIETFS